MYMNSSIYVSEKNLKEPFICKSHYSFIAVIEALLNYLFSKLTQMVCLQAYKNRKDNVGKARKGA